MDFDLFLPSQRHSPDVEIRIPFKSFKAKTDDLFIRNETVNEGIGNVYAFSAEND